MLLLHQYLDLIESMLIRYIHKYERDRKSFHYRHFYMPQSQRFVRLNLMKRIFQKGHLLLLHQYLDLIESRLSHYIHKYEHDLNRFRCRHYNMPQLQQFFRLNLMKRIFQTITFSFSINIFSQLVPIITIHLNTIILRPRYHNRRTTNYSSILVKYQTIRQRRLN